MIRRKIPEGKQCNHPTCGATCRREKKQKGMPANSSRQEAFKKYWPAREKYLAEHKFCECGCGERSVEIHHKKGKIGAMLYDVRFFMAVARKCHRKIELNPTWAKEMGYSISRHKKTESNETQSETRGDGVYPEQSPGENS